MNNDFRKKWFCEYILTFLGENDPKLLNKLLNFENTNDDPFDAFLEKSETEDICNKVLTIYKTFYNTIVEEEVVLQEEVEKQRSGLLTQKDEKKKEKKGKSKKKTKKSEKVELEESVVHLDDDVNSDGSKGLKKKKKALKKSGRTSPYTMMDNPQQDDRWKLQTSLVPIKRTVQKVIELAQVQYVFGTIDHNRLEPADCYIYFIKKNNKKVPFFGSTEEANINMPLHFYVGCFGDNMLNDLQLTLNLVFIPLFQEHKFTSDIPACNEDKLQTLIQICHSDSDRTAATRNKPSCNFVNFKYSGGVHEDSNTDFDFTEELKFLMRTLKWAHVELESRKQSLLIVPTDFEEFLRQDDEVNHETVKKTVISYLFKWPQLLDSFISYISEDLKFLANMKNPVAESLLSEYYLWKETEMKVAAINDNLESDLVQRVVAAVKKDETLLLLCQDIEDKKITLNRIQELASENSNTLRTHRAFFVTFISGDFDEVTKIIPRFIESLKSVWILSEYYGEEKNMLRLLQNTKSTLCNRVKKEFEVTVLFRQQWQKINEKLNVAKDMLQTWKKSYLETRHSIESNTSFFIRRWEFSKEALFSETDYITSVLQDIVDVLKIVKQYQNLFKLSGLTEIPGCKIECKNLEKKIDNLTSVIEKADFDIYLEIFRDEWQEILEISQQNVIEIDQHLKILIIKTFSQIKSLQESMETVKNIFKIETRPTIHDSLPYMCNKIIIHIIKEVKQSEQLFEKNESNTHLNKYKICDNILWAENMMKNLVQQKERLKDMMHDVPKPPVFNEAMECHHQLETKLQNYIEAAFKTWTSNAASLITDILTENVIDLEEFNGNKNGSGSENKTFDEFSSVISGKVGMDKVTNTLNWITNAKLANVSKKQNETSINLQRFEKLPEFIADELFIERGYRFKLKVQPEIFDVIEHLHKLNLKNMPLTNKMRNLLLTTDSLQGNIEKINKALSNYNEILSELKPDKITLLRKHLLDIEHAFQPGMELLTWQCSGLEEYCQKTSEKCNQLICLMYQMQKIFDNLDSFVISIENINFFPIEQVSSTDVTCEEFTEKLKLIQRENVDICLRHYETISETLIQLESLVLRTHSGKSPIMVRYYNYYSTKIAEVLNNSVLQSTANLKKLFEGFFPTRIKIFCYLVKDQIKVLPTCAELFETIKITMIQFFTRLKCMKCWQPDSALITNESTATLVIDEIIKKNEVQLSCTEVLHTLQELCNLITKSLTRWFKYSILWQYDKDETVARFASVESPNLSDYEQVYNFYTDVSNKIDLEDTIINIRCVDINTEELIRQLKLHCNEWKSKLSAQLALDTNKMVSVLSERILKMDQSLNEEILNIQSLTNVLTTINEIEFTTIDVDIQLYQIEEHYHELKMQNFKVDDNIIQSVAALKSSWQTLLDTCLYRKFVLEPMRVQVIPNIKCHIDKFIVDCHTLKDEYDKEYPAFESSHFHVRLDWILKFVNRHFKIKEEEEKLKRISSCYEIVFPKIRDLVELTKDLDFLKREYRIL